MEDDTGSFNIKFDEDINYKTGNDDIYNDRKRQSHVICPK